MTEYLERLLAIFLSLERRVQHVVLRATVRLLRFLTITTLEFYRSRCLMMASALTITSLLALVPVTTFFFAVYSRFPAFQQLQDKVEKLIYKHLVADPDLAQTVSDNVRRFTEATGNVTLISVVALFITAISTFLTIEFALNVIWHVRSSRPLLDSLSHFTALLVWAPILLAFSVFMSHATLSEQSLRFLADNTVLAWLFTVSVSWLLFFLMYSAIPYTSVEWRSSLLGSFVAANFWELAKLGFGIYVGQSKFYTSVYGNLSTIPVFLLWVYVTWLIVLYGAEISFCFQYRGILKARADCPDGGMSRSELAILLMTEVGQAFLAGKKGSTVALLSDRFRVPPDEIRDVLLRLEACGLVCSTANGVGSFWVPGLPLNQINLDRIARAFQAGASRWTGSQPLSAMLRKLFDDLERARDRVLATVTLEEVVERQAARPGAAVAGPPPDAPLAAKGE